MDKIFGEVDAVEAGEQEQGRDKMEAIKLSTAEHHERSDEKGMVVNNSAGRAV